MKLFIGDISPDKITLKEEEEYHIIKVLRMSSGDDIYVTDGKGTLAHGKLIITGKRAEVEVLELFPKKQQDKNRLHIAIAPTKNIDRFEFFIEKAVELGVSEITPILCANSERKNLNIEKIQKQVESACKQSLRLIFPLVRSLTSLKELIQKERTSLFLTHCYKEYKKVPLSRILPQQGRITVLIGPEGDFSKKEVEELYSLGATGVDLGENRLRTETAGIFVAAGHWFSILDSTGLEP
ncbi:MAG: 16S rRNA (uracil(1498)-N(3))-methyltransferase [Flavobacteriaceae bacterium]|jgi:16S rRNA (uracil1498-N3)-methyltransferase|nr:16S rRNA (uracil(1498)-N(3))-methyltransferase [Flavobacteriaceae bacterium]